MTLIVLSAAVLVEAIASLLMFRRLRYLETRFGSSIRVNVPFTIRAVGGGGGGGKGPDPKGYAIGGSGNDAGGQGTVYVAESKYVEPK